MLPPVLWLCGDSHIITRVALCVILFLCCTYIVNLSYNHEFTGDIIVNKDDYNDGIDLINAAAQKRGRSDNYLYMDKDGSRTIDNADIA